jgi:subtilisin family serine protease
MDYIELKYGEGTLKLMKSEKLIAVKPEPGKEQQVTAAVSAISPAQSPAQNTLGGFRVVNVAQAAKPMEATLDELRRHVAVAAGTHVYHSSDDEVPWVPTGQIFIVHKPEATQSDIERLLDENKLQIIEAREGGELVAQVTPQSENPIKAAAALQKSDLIEIAEPDLATPGKIQAFTLPTDTLITRQWHLENTGFHRGTAVGFKFGADARILAAWREAQTLGSPLVIVAVIDDGFDLSHPDLSGSGKVVAPRDFTRNNTSPLPDLIRHDWHGTACAGVAVGNADGSGIVGAAPGARLMPVRWGRELRDSDVERWFNYVREQGAWVVSCSWSAAAPVFPLSERKKRAIARCAREGRNGKGCVICFAAGNESRDTNNPEGGSVNGFANHSDVIAVAACTSRDLRSDYSNFGEAIAICAPSSGSGGWGITTADVMGQYINGSGELLEAGYSPGSFTDEFGGTSSATPLVAGVCALLLSVKPEMTAKEVKQLIQQTARRIGPPSAYDAQGHSREFGFGCIDAQSAVRALIN